MLDLKSVDKDVIRQIIQASADAANAGNRQPWQFDIYADHINISLHPDRNIENDNKLRKTWISFGCAIQNMIICASQFGLEAHYKINISDADMNVVMTFAKNVTPHPFCAMLKNTCVNRGEYEHDYKLSGAQVDELESLSPFKEVKLQLLTELAQQEQFKDIIADNANPKELFKYFSTGSLYGAILADDAFSEISLIETGRLFTLLRCWVVKHDLAIQPVGCYMTGIFDLHHEDKHPIAQMIADLLSDKNDFEPVMAFRIGKPIDPLKKSERARLPLEEITDWRMDED